MVTKKKATKDKWYKRLLKFIKLNANIIVPTIMATIIVEYLLAVIFG
ncbi:MAG: hypothetical protein ACTSRT_03200 [Promethearchaeota archaeon]